MCEIPFILMSVDIMSAYIYCTEMTNILSVTMINSSKVLVGNEVID